MADSRRKAIETKLSAWPGLWRSLQALVAMWLLLSVAGCPNKQTDSGAGNKTASDNTATADRPAVPLRVWFVGDESAAPAIQRQWQASYDRPLELSMVSPKQLLEHKSCDCDVLVYPAMLLGELTARDWLAELPQRLQPIAKNLEDDAVSAPANSRRDANIKSESEARPEPQPPAWQEQAKYGKRTWGLSLSVSMPVLLANFPLPQRTARRDSEAVTMEASKSYWQAVIDALATANSAAASPNASATVDGKPGGDKPGSEGTITDGGLDALAACDRYLVIATSLAASDSRVGLLFDPQTMKPRLSDAEFAEAASIMYRLKAAGASIEALAGSPSAAWKALSGTGPNVSISTAPLADEEVDQVTKITASEPPENPARAGSRTTSGLNSGQGLVVSVARDCRQSSVSVDFVRWLTSDTTRTVFAKRVSGFSAESAYTPSSSAWQAQRISQRLAQQSRVVAEPRLPEALQLRITLGEELIAMLRGEKESAAALKDATTKWNEIIRARGLKVMKPAYEQSLGLSN